MTETKPQQPLPQRVGNVAKALGTDLAALGGAMMIVHGIDLIHRPTAFIVAGLVLIAFSVLAARRS
jgi:D-arabinose 5-phosphate isomerase GutQ